MVMKEPVRIVHLDRISDGLIIEFTDGMAGRYSTALLYRTLTEAEDITLVVEPDVEEGLVDG
jgi:hypothetical protein